MFIFATSIHPIDYPGRIPRGQDHIATAHLKVTLLRWLLFIIREHECLDKVFVSCRIAFNDHTLWAFEHKNLECVSIFS